VVVAIVKKLLASKKKNEREKKKTYIVSVLSVVRLSLVDVMVL
jgi:hypothetical protein